ncbi:hypothetical protein CJ030_MR8G008945 [Morella rubra]|uniref:Uncharacterized protein n=1 Tax=Morella rubra TaxID=262757 RepID=A0A6A1US65_9ROSI|nr:hypothetical protein CJ030_MR8G008945 [Morella rubra]
MKSGQPNVCKNPKLFLMEGIEVGDINHNGPKEVKGDEEEEILEAIEADLEISLHALTGSLNPKTMRVVGRVGGQNVVILIDSGSTHNFLDPSIVKRGHLSVDRGEEIRVRVANGELLTSEGRSENVKISLQGNSFLTDTYVLS